MKTIAFLPGDGIGPEVMAGPAEILQVLEGRGIVRMTGPWPVGASAATTGDVLPASTLDACRQADAVLLGAVGEVPGVDVKRPEQALLRLRHELDLRLNVRHVVRKDGPPLTIVRNLLGGAYGSDRRESDGVSPAADVTELEPARIEEVAEVAVAMARRRGVELWSVDKANLMATGRLWRSVVDAVATRHGVVVRHVYVDQAAYELAHRGLPEAVVVTEGIFGDILSDLAAGVAGSIALCSSASLSSAARPTRCQGLFEPAHGSAPRRAGQNCANPAGAFLALAALLESFEATADSGALVAEAVRETLRSGTRTYDLAPVGTEPATTTTFASCVVARFRQGAG